MYYQHFNLEKKPFQINSNNEFLWLSKKHAIALDSLKRGVAERQGLLALTGDVGTGKTTLLNEIIHTLDRQTRVVKIPDPGVEMYHLFLTIAQTLGFENQYQKGKKFSSGFFPFLKTAGDKGTNVIVIVDEAQRIPKRFLKEITSWSKFGFNQVLTVILVGQLEFCDILRSTLGPAWQNCINVHAFLEPLDEKETKIYINKRLEMAGTTRKIFLISAISEIHIYSKGIPRMINTSCDQALITAFGKNMKMVDVPTVKQATGQLDLPAIPLKKEEKSHRTKNKIPRNNKPWLRKKALTGLAVTACLCILAGYLFNTPPTATKNPPTALPVDIKLLNNNTFPIKNPAPKRQDSISKVPENQRIGLGYTPLPFSEKKKSPSPSPVLIEDIYEINPPAKPKKETPKNMDWFIKEVFLLTEHQIATRETPGKSSLPTDKGQLLKITSEPVRPALATPIKISTETSTEPEPGAIIDWLLKTR